MLQQRSDNNINMTVKTSKRPLFVRSKLMFISPLLGVIKTSSTDFEAVSHTQFLGFGQLYHLFLLFHISQEVILLDTDKGILRGILR